jgi:hypothetical protein
MRAEEPIAETVTRSSVATAMLARTTRVTTRGDGAREASLPSGGRHGPIHSSMTAAIFVAHLVIICSRDLTVCKMQTQVA